MTPGHVPKLQNLRFQGQHLDRETGLHYNTLRFYDPDAGRLINPDPIGLRGGFNFYEYAPNPLMWIDPWGCTFKRTEKLDSHMRQIQRLRLGGSTAERMSRSRYWLSRLMPKETPSTTGCGLNAADNNGALKLYDAKASSTAGFTPNQKTGYPLVGANGGVIESGPMAGTTIGPSNVLRIEPGNLATGRY